MRYRIGRSEEVVVRLGNVLSLKEEITFALEGDRSLPQNNKKAKKRKAKKSKKI
ncbi:MAG TPA: hypothetical protein VMU70_01950 [Candidatus Tyrphobacter sp.]|nr:hypothetical protein [Candidatus Tyrphobacter sp.]